MPSVICLLVGVDGAFGEGRVEWTSLSALSGGPTAVAVFGPPGSYMYLWLKFWAFLTASVIFVVSKCRVPYNLLDFFVSIHFLKTHFLHPDFCETMV